MTLVYLAAFLVMWLIFATAFWIWALRDEPDSFEAEMARIEKENRQ